MLKALRDLPGTRVLVFHPKDRECSELVAQLRRIGCRVDAVWPPQDDIAPDVGIVFLLFRDDALTAAVLNSLAHRKLEVVIFAIIEFESPTVIEAVVNSGAAAVITKPIRAFGLLTSMIISLTISHKEKNYTDRIDKLDKKIYSLKRQERAKSILMRRMEITEEKAYEAIRLRAMSLRVSMDTVCSSIIEASETLDF
jgi:AmiR/NasT family two-component response regulator